ncbi:universal stress protein [Muriicola sp. Z0-33]|nr:universal stress protein [Muriicola sp. Z0-33]
MKNILLPTDFSENAWNAIEYALKLFKDDECTFHLLNTYTPAIVHSRFMAINTEGRLLEDACHSASVSGLENLLIKLQGGHHNPKHYFNTISSFNLLTEEIKEAIEVRNIDMIITGTKGASGLKEIFLGSNTVRIIKSNLPCPVLVVPENFKFERPREIALVTDFMRNFDASIIEPLKQTAIQLEARVRIMRINETEELSKYQKSNLSTLEDYLSEIPTSVHWMPYFASKAHVIQSFIEELGIDLLAMVYHRHGFLGELTREPVIKNLAFHSKIPLLVIPG